MSNRAIAKTVLENVKLSTEKYWRSKYTDLQRIHVYYATFDGLLAGNKPLRELAVKGPEGAKLVKEYSKLLIDKIKSGNYPDFVTKYNNLNPAEVYDWTDPKNLDSVAIVTTQAGKGTGFQKIKNITEAAHAYASKKMAENYPNIWTGFEIDVGHVVRSDQPSLSPAIARAEATEDIINKREFNRGNTFYVSNVKKAKDAVLEDIAKKKQEVYDAHADHSVKYTRDFDTTGIVVGNIRVVVTVQHDRKTNQETLKPFETALGQRISAIVRGLDVARLAGSPGLDKIIGTQLRNVWKGKKLRKGKYVTNVKSKSKLSGKGKLKVSNVEKALRLKIPKVKDTPGKDINLYGIRELINDILAKRVQSLMGKSTDPAVKLRYQTGRFAESAKLLTLTRAGAKTLFGTYTYMRNPYDTFLPNHRLGTPERNPKIYLEGAIRTAAISALKGRFSGIALELV